jgi:hypothetical protein
MHHTATPRTNHTHHIHLYRRVCVFLAVGAKIVVKKKWLVTFPVGSFLSQPSPPISPASSPYIYSYSPMATVIRDGKVIQTTMLNIPSNIIQQKHKHHHENEIVEEHIKDSEGKIIQKNKFVKGKFLGKVTFESLSSFDSSDCDSSRVALPNAS